MRSVTDKIFLAALKGERVERPPFWFMRQAGRYLPEYREVRAQAGGFWNLCFSPELAAEVTLQPLRRFHMDAAILFSDILVIPLALGVDVRFETGEGPKLEPVDASSIPRLKYDQARLMPIAETLKRVRKGLPGDTALIGFAGAPWTVACYMVEGRGSRDFHAVRAFARQDADAFAALISTLADATVAYLRMQAEAGAEALQLFDSWAGVLSEAEFDAYVIAPTRAIVQALKRSHPHLPLIGFPRRAGALTGAYAQATGVDAVGLDEGQPLRYIANTLQPHCAVQGNLDPLLLQYDRKRMMEEAKNIIAALQPTPNDGRKNFLFNLGHGIGQHTPVEHVQALSDYLKAQG